MSILCYHAVDPDWESGLSMDPDEFAAQCRWLAARRTVVPLEEAARRADSKGRLPRGMSAITFDDGFASVLEHGLPALVRNGLPATMFVVAGTLDELHPVPVDWVDDPPDHPLEVLDVDQVRRLEDMGVRVESHTWSHLDLTQLTEEECVRDLRDSREKLSDLLGRDVRLLAYPRGRHDAKVRRAAERAGYTYSFALPEAPEPPGAQSIPRVGIYPGNGTRGLAMKSTRWYVPLRTSAVFPMLRRAVRRSSS